MKSIEKTSTSDCQKSKMTLMDYFYSLPEVNRIAPRKRLLERVSEKCGVPQTTVRSWFAYGIKPRDPKMIEILAEETGISPENMWDRN